jgi:hypothetical protein
VIRQRINLALSLNVMIDGICKREQPDTEYHKEGDLPAYSARKQSHQRSCRDHDQRRDNVTHNDEYHRRPERKHDLLIRIVRKRGAVLNGNWRRRLCAAAIAEAAALRDCLTALVTEHFITCELDFVASQIKS